MGGMAVCGALAPVARRRVPSESGSGARPGIGAKAAPGGHDHVPWRRHHIQARSRGRDCRGDGPGAFRLVRGPSASAGAAEATADSDGDMLVLAASRADAVTLAARLERAGHAVALQPEAWAQAASGGRIVVGARSAVLAPVACLRAVVVLDAHADSYQEQRVPTWQAAVLATERARRAGIPCLLVSSCPTLELLAGRRLVTLSRDAERSGWAPVALIDARDEDPRAGGYPTRLATLIREAVAAEPHRRVLAVLNRKGRARLLACGRCRSLLRCGVCGTALVQLERPSQGELAVLHCPRCASSGPAVCSSCGPTRPRIVRPGVARAREDLAALTGLDVAEIARPGADPSLCDAPVLVGTEAVLHRAGSASLVVFLDFDVSSVAVAGTGAWRSGRGFQITRSWPQPCTRTPACSSLPRSLAGHCSGFPPPPHWH